MFHKTWKTAAIVLGVLLLAGGCSKQDTMPAEEISRTASLSSDSQTQHQLEYAAYPPYRILSNSHIQTLAEGETAGAYTAADRLGYRFVGWSDGVTTKERSGDTVTADTVITALYEYDFTLNTPVISIYTDEMKTVGSKTEYQNASLSTMNCHYRFERTDLSCQIKGRGNSSWKLAKRPYTLRFENKVNLLGTGDGAAKKWLLIPNHGDQSLLRNYAAYYMGDLLPGIEYSPNCKMVELYLNGVYQGVYMLCEDIHFQQYRIDLEEPVDDSEDEIDFIVELDGWAPDEGRLNRDYVYVRGYNYTLCTDFYSDAQLRYIRRVITNVDDAVNTGDKETIAAVVDLDSFMDSYILLEFFMNVDAAWSSVYFYHDASDGKFYFGPPWDYDLSSGNDYRLETYSYDQLYVGKRPGEGSDSTILRKLTGNNEWFIPDTAERWLSVKYVIEEMLDEIERVSTTHRQAIDRNFEKWPVFGKMLICEPTTVQQFTTYDEHVDYLVYWLRQRYEWMDSYFAEIRNEYSEKN